MLTSRSRSAVLTCSKSSCNRMWRSSIRRFSSGQLSTWLITSSICSIRLASPPLPLPWYPSYPRSRWWRRGFNCCLYSLGASLDRRTEQRRRPLMRIHDKAGGPYPVRTNAKYGRRSTWRGRSIFPASSTPFPLPSECLLNPNHTAPVHAQIADRWSH